MIDATGERLAIHDEKQKLTSSTSKGQQGRRA